MIQRRAKSAGVTTHVGNYTFRATGVTAYLKNGGTLERTAQMANHASIRTTQLYDRRAEEVTLDEVERTLVESIDDCAVRSAPEKYGECCAHRPSECSAVAQALSFNHASIARQISA